MERRQFLKSSLITTVAGTGALATGSALAESGTDKAGREFYELRTYLLKDDTQRALVEAYLEKAFIPAMNRLGSSPIGVFNEQKPNAPLRVLIPYTSMDHFLDANAKLLSDAAHNEAGAPYLTIEAPNRAYERIDSALLRAFEGMPKLALPKQSKEKQPRLLQLRTYSSHSEVAGQKKIEMFNKGEIDIFKRIGAAPVFFSENLIGSGRPHLTYMLSFDDKAALDKAWGAFGKDPGWIKMRSMPEYSDKKIVSAILNILLTPASYSQI